MLSKKAMKHYMGFMSLVLVFVFIMSTEAKAVIYPFSAVSYNSTNADAMAAQLSLEILDVGGEPYKVEFRFRNDISPYTGTQDGVIIGVYFEDGTLLDMGEPTAYEGTVDFKEVDPTPHPWGLPFDDPTKTNAFEATKDGSTSNGVNANPGEILSIVFDLDSNENWTTFMTALQNGFDNELESESLRIGIHVGNLDSSIIPGVDTDGSDAYILTPIPSAVLLGILGLGVAGIKLRKFA